MKRLLILLIVSQGCGTIRHQQEENFYRFFSQPQTYDQTVMRLGIPTVKEDLGDTFVATWQRLDGVVAVMPIAGMMAAKYQGWALTAKFSKASGYVLDWRFIAR